MILPVTSLFSRRIRKECRPWDGAREKSAALASLGLMHLPDWMHLAALSLIFVLAALTAHAQVSSALLGIVEDPSGSGVSGAKVVVTNVETGATRTVLSDESGNFSVVSLAPGPHEVKVEKPGFKASSRTGIHLKVA